MADLYSYLPGFQVTYKDGGLVVPRPVVSTDSVLLIGTATDGPKWEPVQVYRPEDAEILFGKAYDVTTKAANGTTLMLGMLESYQAGCRDVRLCRIGGKFATGALDGATGTDKVALRAKYAGSLYNTVSWTISVTYPSKVVFTKPVIKGGTTFSINIGDKATATLMDDQATPAAAVVLTAKNYGVAGNEISYKVDLTAAAEKFIFKENDTATPIEVDISGTVTLTQLCTAITGAAGNDFLDAVVDAGATGTEVTKDTLAAVADFTKLAQGVDSLTLNQLVNAINTHSSNNVFTADLADGVTGTNLASAELVATVTSGTLAGGEDGTDLTDVELYHELYHAYALLEDHEVDNVVPVGVYADKDVVIGSVTTNYAEQLANHCFLVSSRNSETSGAIACEPITTVSQATIKTKIEALKARENIYYLQEIVHTHADEEDGSTGTFTIAEVKDNMTGESISVGQHIDVIAMPELLFVNPVVGRYYAPGAAAYAGYVSVLRPESAPTNKIVPNARGMRYKLSPAQLNDLTGSRYITFRERSLGAAITDGCTAAAPGSDYGRRSTMRITFAAMNVVRTAAEPFIGEPNELPQRNALNTAIKSGLENMKEAGALTGYRFNISATLEQKLLGESYIDLELVPAMENRKIRVSIALRPSL